MVKVRQLTFIRFLGPTPDNGISMELSLYSPFPVEISTNEKAMWGLTDSPNRLNENPITTSSGSYFLREKQSSRENLQLPLWPSPHLHFHYDGEFDSKLSKTILIRNVAKGSPLLSPSHFQSKQPCYNIFDGSHIMGNQNRGFPWFLAFLKVIVTLALEGIISYRKWTSSKIRYRLGLNGNRKGQNEPACLRVVLKLLVHEFMQLKVKSSRYRHTWHQFRCWKAKHSTVHNIRPVSSGLKPTPSSIKGTPVSSSWIVTVLFPGT